MKGTKLHRMPKGIFCLAENLTEAIATIEKDQIKEFYQPSVHKGKILIIANCIFYNCFVTYCYLAALKSRSDLHTVRIII